MAVERAIVLHPPRRGRTRAARRRARPAAGRARAHGCSTARSTPRLTLVSIVIIVALAWPTVKFLFVDAVWTGSSRLDCLSETVGREGRRLLAVHKGQVRPIHVRLLPGEPTVAGRCHLRARRDPARPAAHSGRARPRGLNAILFFRRLPARRLLPARRRWCSGLPHVETRVWGGLLVTLVISFTGIIFSLPLGILLALGRRSQLPIVRHGPASFSSSSGAGVPLITVLFFATYMLPLFLPDDWRIDALARVLIGGRAVCGSLHGGKSYAAACRRSPAASSRVRWRSGSAIGG